MALAMTLASMVQAKEFQAAQILSVTSGKGQDNVATHRWAIFTVQIGDIIYTGSGKRIHHQSDDYSEGFSAGEAVSAAIDGDEMTVRKANGKELKTKIIKKVRAEQF